MPTSSIPDWPALETAVARLAKFAAERKRLEAIVDAATAKALTAHEHELRLLSDLGAIDAATRSNVELFCREHRAEIVTEEKKSRDLAGGASVAFALDPPSVKLAPKKKVVDVIRAICRKGKQLAHWIKPPRPDLQRQLILLDAKAAQSKSIADAEAFKKQLAGLGLELAQAERFELKLAGE